MAGAMPFMATTCMEQQVDPASKTNADQVDPMRKSEKSVEPFKNPISTRIENSRTMTTVQQKSNVEFTSKYRPNNTPMTTTQQVPCPEPIASATTEFRDTGEYSNPMSSQGGSGPEPIEAVSPKYSNTKYTNPVQTATNPTHQIDEDEYDRIMEQGRVVVLKGSQLGAFLP